MAFVFRPSLNPGLDTDGLPLLKKAIIRYTEENYDKLVAAENAIVSAGAKQAIFNVLYTILNPQEEVILLAPYWVSYPEMVKMVYGVPVIVRTCFGGPFMVHHPAVYAELLRRKVLRYGVTCWLVDTGWTGGPYGVGKRISIGTTRVLLNAALSGKLLGMEYTTDPVFGFQVPTQCEGVPPEVLNPAQAWPSQEVYMQKYRELAARFVDNFKKFEDRCPPEVVRAGPRL